MENGANVEEIAHQYIHSLPRDQEEIINNMIRQFKLNLIVMTGDGQIQDSQSITLDFNEEEVVETIPVYDNDELCNPEIAKQRKGEKQKKKEKYERHKNPTRAMKKRELQQIISEEEDDLWER